MIPFYETLRKGASLFHARRILRFQFRDYPAYVEAREAWESDPGNLELKSKMDLEYRRMVLSKEEFEHYEKMRNR